MRFLLLIVLVLTLTLVGCNTQTESRADDSKLQSIVSIKEEAIKGKIKGMEIQLRSTYSKVVELYGEPKEIGNEECWTYTHDHPKTKVNFYFNHDSCAGDLNVLKPEAILNKISVPVESLSVTAEDVKLALGKPNEEYPSESYGGYYLIYELDQSQLVFFAKDTSPPLQITKVQLISTK
ncbi:hypothetical protein SAMN04487970_102712 [Paenibacillus tianmuensis]|uniref:DUF4309 domain-containing protein n=1 Tax=Paenibacillus tianmuensis TaxID=624147 RepID=A0A1G4SEA9_9BACL|nr:hypothetical protein [Paenibacillus tianmuensis]SCW67398.1 hypothetical protein SAMN04487970_102712 [Paenibacillus tianmuensis]